MTAGEGSITSAVTAPTAVAILRRPASALIARRGLARTRSTPHDRDDEDQRDRHDGDECSGILH